MGDYLLFWVLAVGALSIAVVLIAVLDVWSPKLLAVWPLQRSLIFVAVVAWMGIGAYRLTWKHGEQARDTTMRALASDLRHYCEVRGISRPLVDFDPSSWQELAGLVLQFAKSGAPIAVSPRAVQFVGSSFAETHREEARFFLMPVAGELPQSYQGRVEWVGTRGAVRVVRIVP